MRIAVVAYFVALRGEFQKRIAVFCRPTAAYEESGFEAVFAKDFGNFKHVVGALVYVEHKSDASRVRIAVVHCVVDLLCLRFDWVRRHEGYAENKQKYGYYDKICAKIAEPRFTHTIKYDCDFQTM